MKKLYRKKPKPLHRKRRRCKVRLNGELKLRGAIAERLILSGGDGSLFTVKAGICMNKTAGIV